MVKWHPKLYKTERAALIEEEIKAAIESGKASCQAYIITLAANKAEQLDIYNIWMFLHSYLYKDGDPVIVGLAKTEEESRLIIEAMAGDVYAETGACELRKYFS